MKFLFSIFTFFVISTLSAQFYTKLTPKLNIVDVSRSATLIIDIDGDGDSDILLTGESNAGKPVSKVYINNGEEIFTVKIGSEFEAVTYGTLSSIDIENDGDKDLLVTGRSNNMGRISELYINDGTGFLAKKTDVELEGVSASSSAIFDFDNDGDDDILITGQDNLDIPISKLYVNDGVGGFTVKLNTSFSGVKYGSIATTDFDADGDMDVLITGENNIGDAIARLYINDGNGEFEEKVDVPFEGVTESAIVLADLDSDNDDDVVITGKNNFDEPTSKLYINNGENNFIQTDVIAFENVYSGSIVASDVDNDNDIDIILSGRKADLRVTTIYLNDGNAVFEESIYDVFDGLAYGSIEVSRDNGSLGQFILISGSDVSFTRTSQLYVNDGTGKFSIISGSALDHVILGSVASADIDGDGDNDIILSGLGNGENYLTKCYQNDGSGIFTEKQFPFANGPFGGFITGYINGDIIFCDIDADNDQDLLITGQGPNADQFDTKLFINDGSGNFSENEDTPFVGVRSSSMDAADVDGDGDNDIIITGFSLNPFGSSTRLYLNDGLGNFTENENAVFIDAEYGSVSFFDAENDGDQDLFISGDIGFVPDFATSKLYLNDGFGNFTEYENTLFEGVVLPSVAISDIDNDNDKDIIVAGRNSNFEWIIRGYKNVDGIFMEFTTAHIEALRFSNMLLTDANGDGYKDLVLTGKDSLNVATSKLYLNDKAGNFEEEINSVIEAVSQAAMMAVDIDGDGGDDLVIAGNSGFASQRIPATNIYINNNIVSTTEIEIDRPDSNFQISPNPTSLGMINIDLLYSHRDNVNFSIYDTFGNELINQSKVLNNGELSFFIDISVLKSGIYIIVISEKSALFIKN